MIFIESCAFLATSKDRQIVLHPCSSVVEKSFQLNRSGKKFRTISSGNHLLAKSLRRAFNTPR